MFSFLKSYIILYLRLLQLYLTSVQAAEYVLIPEYEQIIAPCDSPDDGLFSNTVDLSDMSFNYNGDTVEVKGSLRTLWHSGPNENLEFSVNTYKKLGADFVPTFFNIRRRDGCKSFFDPSEIWYKYVPAHIVEEDRVCITHHQDEGVYRLKPFNASLRIEIDGPNIEGTYKVIIKGKSYGNNGQPTGNEFCLEALCELYIE